MSSLLESGAKTDMTDPSGNTPLHLAVMKGHADVVKILLDHESNIHAKNSQGQTPLTLASDHDFTDVIDLLVEKLCKSVEDCDKFAQNAMNQSRNNLADRVRRHKWRLQSGNEGVSDPAEFACYEALHAYEDVVVGRRASRMRPSIKKHGMIGAVDRLVSRKETAEGLGTLKRTGYLQFSFEAVVKKFPDRFSEKAVGHATKRLQTE